MARSKSPKVIDGYSSVRAVRKSTKGKREFREMPSRTKLPLAEERKKGKKRQPEAKPEGRFRHTIVPEKYDITCYECGYRYTLQGRIHNTICPKCHVQLEMGNHVISDEWDGTIKTIGRVEIAEGAITKGEVLAREILIKGNAEETKLVSMHRIELFPKGKFSVRDAVLNDVLIHQGARLVMNRKFPCRNLNVEGELKAKVFSEGIVSVHPGGLLRGEVHGNHLVVEDGGGLKAKLFVQHGRQA